MKQELLDDLYLFSNDLKENKVSVEGKFVMACWDMSTIYHNDKMLEDALKIYWHTRNGEEGLHWNDDEEREKAREFDKYIADLYREQN